MSKKQAWIKFSDYKLRSWSILLNDTRIHMSFRVRRGKFKENRYVEVRWNTSRFRGVKYSFEVPRPIANKTPWKEVFKKLRISLSYALNLEARAVTDRLLQANNSEPIHRRVVTSKAT